MRVFITGIKGQLGQALLRRLTEDEVSGIDLPEVDITQLASISAAVAEAQPEVIIHCAAYTDVDGCARDPQLAYRVNGLGSQNVALAARAAGAAMVHISTNEVFDGRNTRGYEEWMPLSPGNPYGRSKAAGERHVQRLLQNAYIVRTAWAYAPGGRNFVHAILRIAREKGAIRVVTDEIGNPTYMADVADAIAQLITTGHYGVYHFVNEGSCSRWAFANEILRCAGLHDVQNQPILSNEFRRPSTPPAYGALHNVAGAAIGIRLRPWQEAVAEFIAAETSKETVETKE